jgi:hypothetical protein
VHLQAVVGLDSQEKPWVQMKKVGLYRLEDRRAPQKLIYEDKSIGRPTKARNADRVMFTMQTFVEFPNHYVANLDFAAPRQVTDANPQQAEFGWGRNILIEYKNSKGIRLQATLTLPGIVDPI